MEALGAGRKTGRGGLLGGYAGWLIVAVLLLALVAVPNLVSMYTTYLLFTIFLYIAIGEGWNLLGGYTGMVSLGHAAFFGLGAYACALLLIHAKVPLLVGILGGGAAAALFAVLVSGPMFRFRGIYFTIGTLVLAEALRLWMIAWNVSGGAKGLSLPAAALPDLNAFYYIALALAVAGILFVEGISRSKLGMGLRAIRDNEDVARNVGVNTFRSKLASVVVSTFITGMAGATVGAQLGFIEPYSIFGMSWSVSMVNMVIIGGIGTLAGPVVGAFFVVILATVLADYYAVQVVITGLILILVIRFAPLGIWGSVRAIPWVSKTLERAASSVGGAR